MCSRQGRCNRCGHLDAIARLPINFTNEKEWNCKLAFLDTEFVHMSDGSTGM